MDHFLYQGAHLFVPGLVCFILYAVLLITEDVRHALLAACPVNHTNNKVISREELEGYSQRYDVIVEKAEEEYTNVPPHPYYKDGYNLYRRMMEYKHNHLLFLEDPYVEADNNLAERYARVINGKVNQSVYLRNSPIHEK